MSSPPFTTAQLFGGAIVADIPSTFADVSRIRQVPDNQEVYLERDGFSSIVFDIVERVDAGDDLEALRYHLADIVDDDLGHTTIHHAGAASLAKMPAVAACTLLATAPPGAPRRGGPHEPDCVGLVLLLVRLPQHKTDIVVAINVPHVRGADAPEEEEGDAAAGKHGRLWEAAQVMREKVLESLEVKDWGLFVQEE